MCVIMQDSVNVGPLDGPRFNCGGVIENLIVGPILDDTLPVVCSCEIVVEVRRVYVILGRFPFQGSIIATPCRNAQ